MEFEKKKFRLLLLLSSIILSYLGANVPVKDDLKPFSTLASDCSKLDSIKPRIPDVTWSWLIGMYFYCLLVSLIYILPKELSYKWPAINFKINVVETNDEDAEFKKSSTEMPFMSSFLLANWLLNFAGKRKYPKIWLTIFTLGLQTDLLSFNQDVEGEFYKE